MAEVVKLRPKELSSADALKHIRALMKADSKCVKFRPHAQRKGKQRSISQRQMLTALEKGVVTEGPYLDINGNWKLNVSRVAAGQEITCVVIIIWSEQVIVHTAFPGRG
jgi:hypothetical protein